MAFILFCDGIARKKNVMFLARKFFVYCNGNIGFDIQVVLPLQEQSTLKVDVIFGA